ncbi:MAG: hypothetical protein V3T14_05035, partial [Myxococcota bacterium]
MGGLGKSRGTRLVLLIFCVGMPVGAGAREYTPQLGRAEINHGGIPFPLEAAPGTPVSPPHREELGVTLEGPLSPALPGLPAEMPLGGVTGEASPPLEAGFAGIGFNLSFPPDPMLAAGPSSLIAVANGGIAMFAKDGAPLASRSLNAFFNGALSAGDTFDPRVIFDPHSQRFFVVSTDGKSSPESWLRIAASKTSSPGNLSVGTAVTDHWWGIDIDADLDGGQPVNDNWADFPGLGADLDNLVVTANMVSNGGAPRYARVWILRKTELLSGFTPTVFEFGSPPDILVNPDDGSAASTLMPALNFDLTPEQMVSRAALIDDGTGRINLWSVNDPAGTPTL